MLLPVPARGATVSPDVIDAVLRAGMASGIVAASTAEALRARCGIGGALRNGSATRVPERALLAVWEAIVEQAEGDHGVGALLALHADIRAFGLLGEALHHARSLRDAYVHLGRYARLFHQGILVAVDPEGAQARVRYALAGAPGGRDARARAAGLLWAASNLALVPTRIFDVALAPAATRLACPPPMDSRPIRQVFGEHVRFGATDTQICFDGPAFRSVERSCDAVLLRYLDALADRELEALPPDNSIVGRVEIQLRRLLVGGTVPSLAMVADALHLSRRTLQRRLADECCTFDQILDSVRKARARDLLSAGQRTMGEIAYLLGYADQAAFSRAAKRWFGVPPSSVAPHDAGYW